MQSGTLTPDFRWELTTCVVNVGDGRPYNVSVKVSYLADSSYTSATTPSVVRLDMERRKTW
jgi:hypothetical protein